MTIVFVCLVGGLTFLFPALAAILSPFLGTGAIRAGRSATEVDVGILIPAYHEADTLSRTIQSVRAARDKLLHAHPQAKVSITVGLDGSDAKTGEIARSFSDVKVLDRGHNRGKWHTLHELAAQNEHQWSALVDAGTLWPEHLLTQLADELTQNAWVGIAPGYAHREGGMLERLIWWQERFIKRIENLAGGPVSLHGATMFFRTTMLKDAFEQLKSRNWLNDDVVLALAMRCRGRVAYLGDRLCVSDCGVRAGAGELTRRRRILRGNIEWIREILPQIARHSPVVALLALRRVARLFWAYFILGITITGGFTVGAPGWLVFIGTAALCSAFAAHPRLREAAKVSLMSPTLIVRGDTGSAWA